jgi:hypothetical protein
VEHNSIMFFYLSGVIPFPLDFAQKFSFLDSHANFCTGYFIPFLTMTLAEVKVVVVFDAASSGLSTHKETYKG